MVVTITEFRREIFELVNRAMEGQEVWVTHKGRRFRISPDGEMGGRLSRITPLDVVGEAGEERVSLQQEMEGAWERDWAAL